VFTVVGPNLPPPVQQATAFVPTTLRDRSPTPDSNVLLWPKWYRDTNNLALGLCKSQEPSPNPESGGQPMCLPIAVDDLAFAGNIGSENFYNLVSQLAREVLMCKFAVCGLIAVTAWCRHQY
jgi:hypothetical protein